MHAKFDSVWVCSNNRSRRHLKFDFHCDISRTRSNPMGIQPNVFCYIGIKTRIAFENFLVLGLELKCSVIMCTTNARLGSHEPSAHSGCYMKTSYLTLIDCAQGKQYVL